MKAFNIKETGLITSVDFKQKHIRIGYWIMFAIILAIALVFLFPALWIILSSFKDVKEFLSTPPTLFPHSFHPEKLVEVWKKMNISLSYLNTMIVVYDISGFPGVPFQHDGHIHADVADERCKCIQCIAV